MPRAHRPPRARPLPELVPWTPPSPQRVAARIAVATAIAALAAAAAGWFLRGTTDTDPPARPAPAVPTTVGPFVLEPSPAWFAVKPGADLPDTGAAPIAAFAPRDGASVRLVATVASPDHPSLIPPVLRDILREPALGPRNGRLLDHAAWRYDRFPAAGDRLADITVAPTSGGILAVACLVDRTDARTDPCSGALTALRLTGGTWKQPSPDLAARAQLPPVLDRLDRARLSGRAALRRARTPRAQSDAAARLRAALVETTGAIRPFAVPGSRTAAVLAAVGDSARAYGRLAAAAAARAPAPYRAARRAVVRHDGALRRAVARLTAAP